MRYGRSWATSCRPPRKVRIAKADMSKWLATSAALWAVFVFIQTGSHRDYFILVPGAGNPDEHAESPTTRVAWISFGVLVLALVTVVGLAKVLSPAGGPLRRPSGICRVAPWISSL